MLEEPVGQSMTLLSPKAVGLLPETQRENGAWRALDDPRDRAGAHRLLRRNVVRRCRLRCL